MSANGKTEPVYLHALEASNFKRLELVKLSLDAGGGVTLVTGDNGQGKSSLLDAIMVALAGRDALPDRPVRAGEERADITIDLGDRIVERKIKADGTSTLTLKAKETGAKFPSPQKLLDDLVGALAFDPLAFAEQKPAEQAATLRRLVGLDTRALDDERARTFAERTEVNREVKRFEVERDAIVVPAAPTEIGDEIDVAVVAAKKADVERVKAANDKVRADAKRAATAIGIAKRSHADAVKAAEDARKAAEMAARAASAAADLVMEAEMEHAEIATQAGALVDPDASAVDAEIAAAREHNAAVSARRDAARAAIRATDAKLAADKKARDAKAASDALTSRLDAIDAEKAARLAAVQFPIPGLSVDGDLVTLAGIPLAQVSSAERLRCCLAIAAALNPRLRVLLVREGNDLDRKSLRLVAEWATAHGFQVLMERVAGEQPAGVVIEAGRVVGDYRERTTVEVAS